MEPKKKNKPNALVIVLFGLIILMMLVYFVLVMFFPSILEHLTTGELQAVPDK